MNRLPTIVNLGSFRATDREQCGVIVIKRRWEREKARVIETPNSAPDPVNNYAITVDDYNEVLELIEGTEYEVIGFFHTHLEGCTAEPSENDLKGASLYPDYLNCVYKPATGEMTWYGGKF